MNQMMKSVKLTIPKWYFQYHAVAEAIVHLKRAWWLAESPQEADQERPKRKLRRDEEGTSQTPQVPNSWLGEQSPKFEVSTRQRHAKLCHSNWA
jgi:hypothetical protein